MEFKEYLKLMVTKDASDLFLSVGAPPTAKFHGVMKPLRKDPMSRHEIAEIAHGIMDEAQKVEFQQRPEMNLAISETGVGRFRVNIFKQRNTIAIVIRNIKTVIPDVRQLELPAILTKVIVSKRGLVLFVGATGCGKSTSLASLIDFRNAHSTGHIITIEDPIEFIHNHKKSIVNQREVGLDTDSYEDALKNTLRQAPDVIFIGEIRDRETMNHAISFSETGHLVISTLHANNANQALDRIINFFPEDRRRQLLLDLSLNIQAFVSQRLVRTVDGRRTAAFEILLGTPLVRDIIRRGEIGELKEVMEKSENLGMRTFDSALFNLYQDGRIDFDNALHNSDSPNNLRLKINLSGKSVAANTKKMALSLMDEEDDSDVSDPIHFGSQGS